MIERKSASTLTEEKTSKENDEKNKKEIFGMINVFSESISKLIDKINELGLKLNEKYGSEPYGWDPFPNERLEIDECMKGTRKKYDEIFDRIKNSGMCNSYKRDCYDEVLKVILKLIKILTPKISGLIDNKFMFTKNKLENEIIMCKYGPTDLL